MLWTDIINFCCQEAEMSPRTEGSQCRLYYQGPSLVISYHIKLTCLALPHSTIKLPFSSPPMAILQKIYKTKYAYSSGKVLMILPAINSRRSREEIIVRVWLHGEDKSLYISLGMSEQVLPLRIQIYRIIYLQLIQSDSRQKFPCWH